MKAAKQRLRSIMRQRLAALHPEAVLSQSHNVFRVLQDSPPYRDARSISIFLSMPIGEVQTDAIVRHALACGKQVFVPYLHAPEPDALGAPPRVMDMVSLADLHDYENLQPDCWGIPSVDPGTISHRRRVLATSDQPALDLMFLPGVAFDLDDAGLVRRLGYGKGFYDFFLSRYFARERALLAADGLHRPPLLLLGLALAEQLLSPTSGEQVPVHPHDQRLHGVVLGNGQVRGLPLNPPLAGAYEQSR